MKILHTSDWHIGRQFHNVSLLADQKYVLDQIVDIAREQAVDVVVIAGDIYDRSVPPAAAVALLDEVLHRLCSELAIPVILIAGNHDSHQRLGFGARQLGTAGLFIVGFSGAEISPVLLSDEHGDVAFYGIPYVEPATVRDQWGVDVQSHDAVMAFLSAQIQQHNQKLGAPRSVVISHCFLDGGEESESERPLSVGGAERVSANHFSAFDYTALGHLHRAQYKGAQHIRYSGSILKYSFSETQHTKSVTLVDMDANGHCNIETIKLKPLHDMRVIEGELESILDNAKSDPNADDFLLVRLTDSHAILNIMSKLRDLYPNVLHLERPGLLAATDRLVAGQDHLKKSEVAMFADFFQQVTGEAVSAAQQQILAGIVDQIRHSEDGS